jgi:hypothetical protein
MSFTIRPAKNDPEGKTEALVSRSPFKVSYSPRPPFTNILSRSSREGRPAVALTSKIPVKAKFVERRKAELHRISLPRTP